MGLDRLQDACLNFVAAEDVVLFAAGTLGATQAANQEHGDSRRRDDGQETSARYQPLNQGMHNAPWLSTTPLAQMRPEFPGAVLTAVHRICADQFST